MLVGPFRFGPLGVSLYALLRFSSIFGGGSSSFDRVFTGLVWNRVLQVIWPD